MSVNDYDMKYTLEVWKVDGRVKKNGGKRFIESVDYEGRSEDEVRRIGEEKYFRGKGYVLEVYKTYIKRVNLMSGLEYYERYNTPIYCSPSSESYWSM